jgi:cytoskeletal protein RodZ
MSQIARLFKQARDARGLSLAQVAAEVSLDEDRLAEIEEDCDEPLFTEGMELCRFYGVKPGEVFN